MNFIFYLNVLCNMNYENTYVKPYYWKKNNMPTLIELMSIENKIEIRNGSMFIMKSFETRKKTLF